MAINIRRFLNLSGIILIVLILSAVLTSLSFAQRPRIIILWPNPEAAKSTLQLQTFPFIEIPELQSDQGATGSARAGRIDVRNSTGSSIPRFGIGDSCPADYIKQPDDTCECWDWDAIACPKASNSQSGRCPDYQMSFWDTFGTGNWYCVQNIDMIDYEGPRTPPAGCFAACIAKPIIYLYPTEPIYVDVEVVAPGEVFVSDPLYPSGGWKNVLAYPDGRLEYGGKSYSELFYETKVTKEIEMPDSGIVIAKNDIENKLRHALFQYGLKNKELEEFLEFWVPALERLNSKYVFFSILSSDIKEAVDKLNIFPEPDTRIEIIAYFKPLDKVIAVKPLSIPESAPKRTGFTTVEWGGTIVKD